MPELLDLENSLMFEFWKGESIAFQGPGLPEGIPPPGGWHHLQLATAADEVKLS